MLTCLEPRPGPSGGEPISSMPATIEETLIQGILAGLSEVVKGLVGAIKAVHTALVNNRVTAKATPPGNHAVLSTGVKRRHFSTCRCRVVWFYSKFTVLMFATTCTVVYNQTDHSNRARN